MISLVVDLAPIENPKPVVSDVEPLLYDFLRPHHHNRGYRQAKSLGGLEVDHQLKLGWLLDRQIGGLGSLKDLVD